MEPVQQLSGGLALEFVANFFTGYAATGLSEQPTYGEREWLEHLLKFANEEPDANLVTLLTGCAAGPVTVLDEAGISGAGESLTPSQALDRIAPGVRTAFIEVLTAMLESPAAAKRSPAIAVLGDPSNRVMTVHRYLRTGKQLRRAAHLMPLDVRTAFAFATLLLLASDRDEIVCRCHLGSCRKFFLQRQSRKGGQPGRKYCTRAHLDEFYRLQTAERVRRYRARKAK